MATLIVDLIAEATERDPDRTAVVCGDEQLSYRELATRSRLLADELVARGAGHERLVCLAIEPSLWAPVAMLATLHAGAAFVPLDPAYPSARLRDMLDQVGGQVLIVTTSTAASRLPKPIGSIIELDRERPSVVAPSHARPSVTADSLAYVIFTSGSTGRPKGVMVPHRGLVNLVNAQIEAFAIERDSVVLQFAPLSFDASVSEVFTALAAGATLCLAPRDELAPGPRLVELTRRHGVTVATLPPSSLALLEPDEFPTLRTIVSAGEACSAAVVAKWAPGRRFVNAYGPTEATVCATMNVCEVDGGPPALGKPLANCTVVVRDEQLAPARSGEIFIGGMGVARGYLGRPDLTAERFVPDPDMPGARMYRTGDLARYRDDGALEFVGRADHQVKVRGHRIELGEVEAVVRAVPGVRDALVRVREDQPGDLRLVAYLIGAADLDRGAVRAATAARLPAFARPTDLVVLADWPRSPAGKVDGDRLPAPVRVGSAGSARSELEFRLTEIWQDVLGVAQIAPTDDFFELGGHSLLAIRMLSRVRAELAVELPLSTVAECRNLAALAAALASRGTRAMLPSPIRLRNGVAQPLFLVPPISGSALSYLPLVRRMTADRPLWGFHAAGLDGGPCPERFADLATQYVRELLAVQSTGSFLLGGWSIGGALAVEMALQLAELGREVSTLFLIDAAAPAFMAQTHEQRFGHLDAERMTFLYVNNFGRCFGIDLGLDRSRFAGVPAGELATEALKDLRRVPAFPPEMTSAQLSAHLRVFAATGQGFLRWRPSRSYRGRVVHFLATEGHAEYPELGAESARNDWSEFVERPIETVVVPGNHFSLVNEPHASVLAAALDPLLAELG